MDYLAEIKANPAVARIPKVFLINQGVRSGKEWVAAVIRKEGLGRLVGSRTAGAFIGGAPFSLFKEKYLLYLAVTQFLPDDIDPIEGIGVSPDVEVSECREFCDGHDPQLEEGLKLLSSPTEH